MVRSTVPFPLRIARWFVLLPLIACGPGAPPGGETGGGSGAGEITAEEAAAELTEALDGLAALPPAPPATRGVIVFSFDTLRADHLGAYGYERDTSPFFDSLAARGTLFTRAVVQYPSTLTSHMSMFTGLYPQEHGVFPPDGVLAPEIESFPQVFQSAGYRTAGHTEGGYMRGRFGLRRGFDEFRARDRQGPREVERTFERGLSFLRGLGPEDRFLLFLHTYAVHAPYEPPPGYEAMFQDGPPPETFPPTGPQLARVNAEGRRLSPEVLAYFKSLYDATLRHLDDTLRSFFSELEGLGLADDVTVVLTSDHGEEFQEHGRMNHTQLYQEVTRVPLVIVHPQRGAGRYEPLVESVDLAPTLYELAGLEATGSPSGISLARVLGHTTGPDGPGRREAWAEEGAGQRALWRGDLHLLTLERDPARWWPRWLETDAHRSELSFEARSWQEPRDLTVEAWTLDAEPGERRGHREVVPIEPTWTPVRLSLPPLPEGTRRHRLRLSVPDCTVPPEVESLRRWRCHGFQVRGLPLGRVELYDLEEDPAEQRDLSATADDPLRHLLRRLRTRTFEPRGERRREALDQEAEEQLRALGYLQ